MKQALELNPDIAIVAFVHAETSTGVLSDARAISELARKYECLTIVDAVTSLGGVPLLVDEWQLDAVYSGSQKCLSCTPGLSLVTFSNKAVEKMTSRKTPVQSWFLDQSLVLGYWSGEGKRSYHQELKQGLEALGIQFIVDEAFRLPQLNAVYIPEGVDDAAVRTRLLNEYNLEIGAGLGDLDGKAWRIGLMGYAAKKENVALCLKALSDVL